MDAQAYYNADGTIERIEISTTSGSVFNRVEFYSGGVLVRSEEDTNGDGRPDKWETYRRNAAAAPGEPPYAITSVTFDAGNGSPQRHLFFTNDTAVEQTPDSCLANGDLRQGACSTRSEVR
jgi:hypothetical protein